MTTQGILDEICLSHPAFWLRDDRDEVFALLRRERPVSWQKEPATSWSDAGRGYWAVTRHSDVRFASRRADLFASGQGTELFDLPSDVARTYSGMLNMDAPEHTAMRAIVNIAFAPRRIATLELDIERRVRAIIDDVTELGECDFAVEIADALPLAVICDLMGVPEADRVYVRRLSQASHPLGDPELGTFDDAYRAVRELIEYGKALLKARLECPSDDLAAILAAAQIDHNELDKEDAGTFFELLVTAGIDTTGAAIAHGLLALSENPDQRSRWRSDFARFEPTAIEEILRWSTPVVHFRRTATADTQLGGERIREGEKVVLFYNSANRDEAVFETPERFDIERRTNPHVTFGGGGPHFCLGAHLARLEMKLLFRALFERLPDIEVAERPVLVHSMFFSGVSSQPCTFTPRTRPDREYP
jgi:cytochrome P450